MIAVQCCTVGLRYKRSSSSSCYLQWSYPCQCPPCSSTLSIMFRPALILSLVTLVLGLSTNELKVTVKAIHSKVDAVDDIIISAIVTNPTDSDIRVIAKNNILDDGPTSSFVVSKGGADLLFTGIRVGGCHFFGYNILTRNVFQSTIDPTQDGVYKIIPAGKSLTVNHTGFAALYDFESSGTGTFTFAPNSVFQTSPTDILKVDTADITVAITKDVKNRELIPLHRRQSTPKCSNSGRQSTIASTLADARALAGGAATDINSHPSSTEYNTYFGGNTQSDIWYNFDRIAGDLAVNGVRTFVQFFFSDPNI